MPPDRESPPRDTVAAAVGDSLARGLAVVAFAVGMAIVTSLIVSTFLR